MNQDDFTRKNPDSASCKSKHQSVARTRIHQLWMFWGIPVNVRYSLPKIGCKGNRYHEDFANQIRSHPAMVSRRATLELHGQFSVRSSVLSTTRNTYARTYKYDDSDFPTWVQVGIKLPFKQFMVQPEYSGWSKFWPISPEWWREASPHALVAATPQLAGSETPIQNLRRPLAADLMTGDDGCRPGCFYEDVWWSANSYCSVGGKKLTMKIYICSVLGGKKTGYEDLWISKNSSVSSDTALSIALHLFESRAGEGYLQISCIISQQVALVLGHGDFRENLGRFAKKIGYNISQQLWGSNPKRS